MPSAPPRKPGRGPGTDAPAASRLRSLLLWLPAAAWYGVIFLFSHQPATVSGGLSDGLLYGLLEALSAVFREQTEAGRLAIVSFLSFFERKAAHMFLYFVLTGLLCLALRRLPPRRRAWAALGLCAALAALDEFHQTWIPGRSGQPRDVLIDVLGGAVFLLLAYLVRCVRIARRAGPSS